MDPEKISIPLHPEIRQRGVFPDPGYRSKTGKQAGRRQGRGKLPAVSGEASPISIN